LNQNLPARDIAGTNPERSVDNAETTDIGRVPAARKLHGKLAEVHAAARQRGSSGLWWGGIVVLTYPLATSRCYD